MCTRKYSSSRCSSPPNQRFSNHTQTPQEMEYEEKLKSAEARAYQVGRAVGHVFCLDLVRLQRRKSADDRPGG